MTLKQRDLVHSLLRNAPFDLGGDATEQRPLLEQMLTAQPLPDDVTSERSELGGVAVVLASVAGSEPTGILFHLHGRGLRRRLGSGIARAGHRAGPPYRAQRRLRRLPAGPGGPVPSRSHDVLAAYSALAEREGRSDRIVVSGESAGGNLAVGLLVAARDAGLPLPCSTLLMSPMTDLTASGASFVGKADLDPNITAQAIRTRVADYLDGTGVDPTDPRVSPIFADLTGLPPMLVQVGSHEVLLDDATRLAVRAAADDVAVTLDVTPDVPHVFQAFAGILDEGAAALDRAAAFVKEHLPSTRS